MKDFIKQKLRESLDNSDKWESLENDVNSAIRPIVEKYKGSFGNDSYAVIDAIYQIFEGMFQKVRK